jgi:peptide/nickel transport system substrate-binding protein
MSWRRTFLSLLLLAAVGLASCGDDNDDGGAAASGGTLVIGARSSFGTGLSTLSPLGSYEIGPEPAALYLNGLMVLDKDKTPQPELATSWDLTPDGRKITFHLRDDVKWHDGTAFTSADVVFSLESYRSPDVLSQGQEYFLEMPVTEVKATDPQTVEIQLSEPYAPILTLLSSDAGVFIVPKHLLEGKDFTSAEFNTKPVGTGPFKVTDFRASESITLDANPDYWKGRPLLDRVILKFIADPSAVYAQLTTGDIQFAAVTPRVAAQIEEGRALDLIRFDGSSCRWLVYNLLIPPFDQLPVRQAVSYAVDRAAIVKSVLSGFGSEGYSLLAPSPFADTKSRAYAFDPKQSEKLMTGAGFTKVNSRWQHEGKPISVFLGYFAGRTVDADAAAVMATSLASAGFDSKVASVEANAFFTDGTKESAFIYASGVHHDPDVLYPILHGSQLLAEGKGFNFSGKADPRMDDLLDRARRTLDEEERRNLYSELEDLVEAKAPLATLYCEDALYAGSKNLSGPGDYTHAGAYGTSGSSHMFRDIEKWSLSK